MKNCLFGIVQLTKTVTKKRLIYNGYKIAFDGSAVLVMSLLKTL